jgi:transcriptional regulator with XRE-family HTH domain
MHLAEWLQKNGVSQDEFADRIKCDRTSVTRYVNGRRMPRREVLARIVAETSGAVTANDFLKPEVFSPAPSEAVE